MTAWRDYVETPYITRDNTFLRILHHTHCRLLVSLHIINVHTLHLTFTPSFSQSDPLLPHKKYAL